MSSRLFFVLLGLVSLLACSETPPPAAAVRPVRTQLVTLSPLAGAASFSGEVRARYETPQGFRVAGKLAERRVEVGQRVNAGQLLARLDPVDLRLSAEAGRAQLAAAEAEHERALADYERFKQLAERKLIARSEFKLREAQYQISRAQLTQAQAQYRVNANQANYAELRAEFAGIVTRIDAEAGQVLAAGQPAVTLARPDQLEVEISIPESRVEEVRQAASVEVSVWAKPELRFPGTLRELAPDTDPVTRTYRARVSVTNHAQQIQLGMTANVHIRAKAEPGITLPLTALYQTKQQAMVWLVDPKTHTVRQQAVAVRAYADNEVVIASGLRAGQRVVTAGVNKLIEGQQVRWSETQTPNGTK